MPSSREMQSEPTKWIKNPHGVVVALPETLFNQRIREYRWEECEPEVVPEKKVYPVSGELSETGLRRRAAQRAEFKAEIIAEVEEKVKKKKTKVKKEEVIEE